jgi:uncharacterized protein YbbC (DUF1343 family)
MTKHGSVPLTALPASSPLALTEAVRAKGRLTVIPMRGWNRAMRWPETELKWVPTSPNIPSFESVIGYAMVGLGAQNSGWTSPFGREASFRGIGFPKKTPEEVIQAMEEWKIPGIAFAKRTGVDRAGKPSTGVYVEITDWDKWNPTELSFYMHKQAAKWSRLNPFAILTTDEARTFKIHVGSTAWFEALKREGARVDPAYFLKKWGDQAKVYREQTKKFWLYP